MIRTVLLVALLVPAVALAQTTVNPGALDRLQPSTPAARPSAAKPATKAAPASKPAPAHRSQPAAKPKAEPAHRNGPAPRGTKLRPGPPPGVPRAPPPLPVLPPAVTAPVNPAPPPPPVPIVPGAEGTATQINGGVRITFGSGKAELNAATEGALRGLARSVKTNSNADLNLYAFAAGVADDPSTPRRLSLSRALAVRAVLISEGIASTRIYPRALGATASPLGPDGPADRVDVVLAGTPIPAAKP